MSNKPPQTSGPAEYEYASNIPEGQATLNRLKSQEFLAGIQSLIDTLNNSLLEARREETSDSVEWLLAEGAEQDQDSDDSEDFDSTTLETALNRVKNFQKEYLLASTDKIDNIPLLAVEMFVEELGVLDTFIYDLHPDDPQNGEPYETVGILLVILEEVYEIEGEGAEGTTLKQRLDLYDHYQANPLQTQAQSVLTGQIRVEEAMRELDFLNFDDVAAVFRWLSFFEKLTARQVLVWDFSELERKLSSFTEGFTGNEDDSECKRNPATYPRYIVAKQLAWYKEHGSFKANIFNDFINWLDTCRGMQAD